MVDHRSTSLPECWPTEYKAPEPSLVVYFCSVLFTPILFYLLYKYSLLSVFSNVLFTLQNSPINPAFDWKKNTYSCQRSWRVSEIIFVQFRAPLDIQWRAQGGAKGPCPPPNRKVRGPMYHLAPPHSGHIRFFFVDTHNTLLFIVYLFTRVGNSHVTTFSNMVCFFF